MLYKFCISLLPWAGQVHEMRSRGAAAAVIFLFSAAVAAHIFHCCFLHGIVLKLLGTAGTVADNKKNTMQYGAAADNEDSIVRDYHVVPSRTALTV